MWEQRAELGLDPNTQFHITYLKPTPVQPDAHKTTHTVKYYCKIEHSLFFLGGGFGYWIQVEGGEPLQRGNVGQAGVRNLAAEGRVGGRELLQRSNVGQAGVRNHPAAVQVEGRELLQRDIRLNRSIIIRAV